ncbi:hypothetical protein [Paenibacillus periandrae]|uniref:hypothetical protein n=1 Tax=Paenibacillus periandrae TaxID=1761741 RepID=UPI001F090570|nr:hypothetical protein [Paenibacillus periandrae]
MYKLLREIHKATYKRLREQLAILRVISTERAATGCIQFNKRKRPLIYMRLSHKL